jgi:hypothetical protein
VRERRTDRGALALVAVVAFEADVRAPVATREDLRGAVGRAVVDDDQLELREVRRQHVADRLLHRVALVEDRHQHGEGRGVGHEARGG